MEGSLKNVVLRKTRLRFRVCYGNSILTLTFIKTTLKFQKSLCNRIVDKLRKPLMEKIEFLKTPHGMTPIILSKSYKNIFSISFYLSHLKFSCERDRLTICCKEIYTRLLNCEQYSFESRTTRIFVFSPSALDSLLRMSFSLKSLNKDRFFLV